MNCEDMVKIPELENVLLLRAGAGGMKNIVRWIYFADCLQCVQSEYKVEDYIHGGEFVILTKRSVTDNNDTLIGLIGKMLAHGISALGINEGQISDELIQYADENDLPLFELPEKYPLIDRSQILCQKLVLEENNKNLEEQLFTSILDSEHLNRESVLAQARYLNVDLSGRFCVVEFALKAAQNQNGDSLALGRELHRIISMEFSFYTTSDILMLSQTGSVLALVSSERIKEEDLKMILQRIVEKSQKQHKITVDIGIGTEVKYLEDVKISRKEAADALNKGNLCETLESSLNHNCNLKETAQALYIHRNTMNYRRHSAERHIQSALSRVQAQCLKTLTAKKVYAVGRGPFPAGEIACMIIESFQGEGGFIPAPIEWVKAVRKICDDNGILMIADEVQRGNCRTGKYFASEYWKEAGAAPDIITTAKSLGAGLPISAITARIKRSVKRIADKQTIEQKSRFTADEQ